MLYHDMTNDYRERDIRVTITLQDGYYTGEIYSDWINTGAHGHGLSLSIINHIFNDLTGLEYDDYDDWDWENGPPTDKTGGFEFENNCGFVIDKDNQHVHFVLHDGEGNKLEKTIKKQELELYIVGIAMTRCTGRGVKRDSRKCAICKNYERIESTASGMCSVKKKKVSQGTTICKYGFAAISD